MVVFPTFDYRYVLSMPHVPFVAMMIFSTTPRPLTHWPIIFSLRPQAIRVPGSIDMCCVDEISPVLEEGI